MADISQNDIAIIPITAEHQPILDKIVDEIAKLKRENNGESFIEFSGDKAMKLFTHQGVIKGFCEVYSSKGLPYLDVYILEDFRGQGLGPAVTIKLKQQLFDRGYGTVGIRVKKNNSRAIESARKSGFIMLEDTSEFGSENQPYHEFIARNYKLDSELKKGY